MDLDVPFDLMEDILYRLPVKSLLRFRCVSRRWLFLIKDPRFINIHLQRSTQTNGHSSLITLVRSNSQLFSVDLNSLDIWKEAEANANEYQYHHQVRNIGSFVLKGPIELIGVCNGLICLSNMSDNSFILWNMCTREHHTLPKAPALPKYSIQYYDKKFLTVGFGYDSVQDDYKVVRINQSFTDSCHEAVIYSLRLNSWGMRMYRDRIDGYKLLNAPFLYPPDHKGDAPFLYPPDHKGVNIINGGLHWAVSDCTSYPSDGVRCYSAILALDLNTEKYREVPLPLSLPDKASLPDKYKEVPFMKDKELAVIRCIGVLGGNLCLMENREPAGLWVMKEYGYQESWTKLFSIPVWEQPRCVIYTFEVPSYYPLAFINDGDELLLVFDEDKLCSYNWKTQKARRIHNIPAFTELVQICPQSLASII